MRSGTNIYQSSENYYCCKNQLKKLFSKTEEYIDRDTFNSAGTYSINGNYLYTIDERQDTVFYKVEENRLRMLDRNKEVITGNLEEHYILKK